MLLAVLFGVLEKKHTKETEFSSRPVLKRRFVFAACTFRVFNYRVKHFHPLQLPEMFFYPIYNCTLQNSKTSNNIEPTDVYAIIYNKYVTHLTETRTETFNYEKNIQTSLNIENT